MTVACFLHVDGPVGQGADLQTWADEVCRPALRLGCPDSLIEAFEPVTVDDPYLGSESGKLLLVQASYSSERDLNPVFEHPAMTDALRQMPRQPEFRFTAEAFRVETFPLQDGSTPPRQAPVSFVVRYYRPIEQEQPFTEYYVAHHPQIQARFPRIRNIFCYLPVEGDVTHHAMRRRVLFNTEVD